ncbi:MAG: sigma-70 family RNA polymerase sigma factor [Sedimentisphaerales bacterium]|nr:sigma-70 family RNA polymerase sigma factor [Sedimentisphaerales bacterium]
MAGHAEQIVDELLVMECQDGSVRAMDRLVERWQKRLWRYAYRLTGDPEAAWDITQESWLAIVRGILHLDDPARFPSWAYRIVTNKARDWMAGAVKARQMPAGHVGNEAGVSGVDDRGIHDDLHALMSRLSEPSRTVLTLCYLEGFAVVEIAAILRVPPGTVKSRLHSARKELKTLWIQESEQRREP